jgi:hypothetical protein
MMEDIDEELATAHSVKTRNTNMMSASDEGQLLRIRYIEGISYRPGCTQRKPLPYASMLWTWTRGHILWRTSRHVLDLFNLLSKLDLLYAHFAVNQLVDVGHDNRALDVHQSEGWNWIPKTPRRINVRCISGRGAGRRAPVPCAGPCTCSRAWVHIEPVIRFQRLEPMMIPQSCMRSKCLQVRSRGTRTCECAPKQVHQHPSASQSHSDCPNHPSVYTGAHG